MKNKKLIFLYFVVMICLAFGITYMTDDSASDLSVSDNEVANAPLAVHFIDVDQGDSIYIKLPGGEHMLIDAGEYDYGPVVAEYLENMGVDKLDYIVATHPHEDHIGGMTYVIEQMGADVLYMPDASSNTYSFERFLDAIENNNIKVKKAQGGVNILKNDNISIDIISPTREIYEEENDYSAVVRLVYGDTAFLFMGDAEKAVEDELLMMSADISADVIKLGHHGSSTSSSEDFMEAVNPALAVISCGKDNSYGHPHRETVSLLKKLDIPSLRTDELGTVIVGSDGNNIIY